MNLENFIYFQYFVTLNALIESNLMSFVLNLEYFRCLDNMASGGKQISNDLMN